RHNQILPQPAVILLSARNDERLQIRAQQLLTTIAQQGLTDADLRDLAYTLQVGREAMEARLGFTVTSVNELKAKLLRYLAGEADVASVGLGDVTRRKEETSLWTCDDDLKQAVTAWLRKGKYAQLIEIWLHGVAVEWNRPYGDAPPRRIPLPTYPF